jgi:hypothetical protein
VAVSCVVREDFPKQWPSFFNEVAACLVADSKSALKCLALLQHLTPRVLGRSYGRQEAAYLDACMGVLAPLLLRSVADSPMALQEREILACGILKCIKHIARSNSGRATTPEPLAVHNMNIHPLNLGLDTAY